MNEVEEILLRRIMAPGDTAPIDVYKRASFGREEWFQAMVNKAWLPAWPVLRNAGTKRQCLFPCYVLPIEDDLDYIMETLKRCAVVFRSGGSVGMNFSVLRPRGAPLSTGGEAAGPVAFMHMFNAVAQVISQSGVRRGGYMIVMDQDHEDIEEFISCKDQEGVLSNMNISVRLLDLDDEEFIGKLAEHTWKLGEPGVLYGEHMKYNCVNLCIAAGMRVLTKRGWVPIELVQVGDEVVGHDGKWHKVIAHWYSGERECIELKPHNRPPIVVTADHPIVQWHWRCDQRVMTEEVAGTVDYVYYQTAPRPEIDFEDLEFKQGYIDGLIYGDGSVYLTKTGGERGKKVGCVFFSSKDRELVKIVAQYWNVSVQTDPRGYYRCTTTKHDIYTYYSDTTKLNLTHRTPEYIAGFITGITDAEGNIDRNMVIVSNTDYSLISQLFYASFLIGLTPTTMGVSRPNKYRNRTEYRIGWHASEFYLPTKRVIPPRTTNYRPSKVPVTKRRVGVRKVYDITVEEAHTFVVEGVVVGNCAEVELPPWGVCNLGSVNLAQLVTGGELDWERLEHVTLQIGEYLDYLIDVNEYPFEEMEAEEKKTRRIGVGVMGWHECLCKLNLSYLEPVALDVASQVAQTMMKVLVDAFPKAAQHMSIAPTGTISLLCNTTPSIEPIHAPSYTVYSPQGNIEVAYPITDVTADQVPWRTHIDMQAAWQAHIDGAISKTILLPHDSTPSIITQAIHYGYQHKLKGLTLYRIGSRELEAQFTTPTVLTGKTLRTSTGTGKLFTTLNFQGSRPYETFITIGRAGSLTQSFTEAIGRLISLCLQHHVPLTVIIDQLRGIRSPAPTHDKILGTITSVPDAIAKALEYLSEEHVEDKGVVAGECPVCHAPTVMMEGCERCLQCGWSRCDG